MNPNLSRDSLRYGYKHSVLRAPSTPGVPPIGEQRMTILVRVGLHLWLLLRILCLTARRTIYRRPNEE